MASPASVRARQVARTTGQFLFAFVAPQTDCEVLEIGGSRGYSGIWLAAGARYLGGRVLSLEADPVKCEAWRKNIADAGLEDWAELIEGDAFEVLPQIADVFDVVFIDAEKDDYEALFGLARAEARAGRAGRSPTTCSRTSDALGAYSQARQADPTLGERDRPARPRPRDFSRPERIATVGLPRKGGGPVVTDSSTGSGGTSG